MSTIKITFFTAVFLFCGLIASAQKFDYGILFIPDSLKQNANAVIRSFSTDITIPSQRKMTIKKSQVITIFNERGLSDLRPVQHYDPKTAIKDIEAVIYNGYGVEIKKFKRKDFLDQTATSGITTFSDSRLLYLSYTPTSYPFTLVYTCEIETSNTAFIPAWYPLSDFHVSLQNATLNVHFAENLGFKKKEVGFAGSKIKRTKDDNVSLSYEANGLMAQRYEDYSLIHTDVFPKLMMGLENFHLEGVDGTAKTWKEFGAWYSDKILTGTTELPEETKTAIKTLVGNEKDPIKKAKIVYDYMQRKSRYVLIYVGIGGWKPMLAKDVDRLGYGDCKALSNYTRALLAVVDVPSYPTLLYGDPEKCDIDPDFVSMQGNHMILSVPDGENYVWLECTSQDAPFGYQGEFTDDRHVLVVKPEGGEIVRTNIYEDRLNTKVSKGAYSLDSNGDLSGSVTITSAGTRYDSKYRIEQSSATERDSYYKDYWSNINNLEVKSITFSNDKEKVHFTENAQIAATSYGNITANRMLFVVNAFNQDGLQIKKIRNRKTSFEIQRGFYDNDEIEIAIPSGFTIESMPDNFVLTGKFGECKMEFIRKDAQTIVYKRSLLIQRGKYLNTEYEDFRAFHEKIARNDNAKIILIKA